MEILETAFWFHAAEYSLYVYERVECSGVISPGGKMFKLMMKSSSHYYTTVLVRTTNNESNFKTQPTVLSTSPVKKFFPFNPAFNRVGRLKRRIVLANNFTFILDKEWVTWLIKMNIFLNILNILSTFITQECVF